MKHIFVKNKDEALDRQIDAVLKRMQEIGVDSDEYPKLMAYLERLNDVKAKKSRNPIDLNTVLLVAGNLAGILTIIAYEQKHVMTSKGFTQILRPKTPTLDN